VELSKDANLLGREVLEAIRKWGLPFLESFESVEDIKDFLVKDLMKKKGKDLVTELYLAVVYSELGNIVEAKRFLGELNRRYPKDPRVERALVFVYDCPRGTVPGSA
jgi:geranylgeranyl pyrophosphate synthase